MSKKTFWDQFKNISQKIRNYYICVNVKIAMWGWFKRNIVDEIIECSAEHEGL